MEEGFRRSITGSSEATHPAPFPRVGNTDTGESSTRKRNGSGSESKTVRSSPFSLQILALAKNGAAAPNPAELRQLDPIHFPLNPQGDFSPPVPQGRRGRSFGPECEINRTRPFAWGLCPQTPGVFRFGPRGVSRAKQRVPQRGLRAAATPRRKPLWRSPPLRLLSSRAVSCGQRRIFCHPATECDHKHQPV